MSFRAFSRNVAVFATFCHKVHRNVKTWYFFRKVKTFGKIDDFSCFFTKWGTFCNFFLKSSWKCQDIVVCLKSCKFWPNRWFFVFLHEMRHFLQLFSEKLMEMQRHGILFENLQSFCQIDDFSCFFTNWAAFCNLLLKGSSKQQNMVVCYKKLHSFGQIDELSCFFTKWGSFWNFLPKSSSKLQNMVGFSKSCKFLENAWVFVLFHEMNQFFQPFP